MRNVWTKEEEDVVKLGMEAGIKAYRIRAQLPDRTIGAILARMDVLKSRNANPKEISPDDLAHRMADNRVCPSCGVRATAHAEFGCRRDMC